MASWAPQQAGLQEILQTIHESTDTRNTAVQRNITHVRPHCPPSYLCTASYDPHFLEIEQLHLCTRLHRQIRTIVGYLLKNSARLILSAALDVTDLAGSDLRYRC